MNESTNKIKKLKVINNSIKELINVLEMHYFLNQNRNKDNKIDKLN